MQPHESVQKQRTAYKQKAQTEEFEERHSRGAFTEQKDHNNNLMNRFDKRDDLPKFSQSKAFFSPKQNTDYARHAPSAPRHGAENSNKPQQSSLQSLLNRHTEATNANAAAGNVTTSTLKYLRTQNIPTNMNYGKNQ